MRKVFVDEDSPLVLKRLTARIGALPNTRILERAAGAEEAIRAFGPWCS